MRMQSRLYLIALVLGLASAAPWPGLAASQGQVLGERYFEAVGDAETIPNNVVTSLAQDESGFIWIGTSDGLIRFDGYRFRHFGHDQQDQDSLSGDFVRSLLATPDGKVWVGTNTDGLNVYDPSSENFRRFRHHTNELNSLSSDTVRSLAWDPSGGLWVGTRDGLDYLPAGQAVVERQSKRFGASTTANDEYIASLLMHADGSLWIGSWNGLARRDPATGQFERWFAQAGDGETTLEGEQVHVMLALSDGRIALGTNGRGSFVFDPRAKTPRLAPLLAEEDTSSNAPVLAMLELANGQLWLGAFGGIDVVDTMAGKVRERLRPDPAVTSSLANDQVRAMLRDHAGQVWIGGYGGGLQRHDPTNRAFRMLRHSPSRSSSLSSPSISSVLEHSDGTLWVGTRGTGIDVVQPDTGAVVRRIQAGTEHALQLRSGAITALTEIDGKVWVGTLDGLHRLDAQANVELWFDTDSGLPNNYVRRLVNGRAGEVWIATDAGLARWTPHNNRIEALVDESGEDVREDFNTMAIDPQGRLWAGSSGGLYVLAPSATRLTRVKVRTVPGARQLHRTVLGLLIDPKGRLWLDTPTGLGWTDTLSPEGLELQPLSMPRGTSEQPFGANVLADAKGRIWTQNFMFDPGTDKVHELGRADGIDLGTPWFRAYGATRAGLLLYGGSKGLLVVDPVAFQPWQFAPPLVWTELAVDGQIRPVPQAEGSGIVLNPGERGFTLEYAALDFSAPRHNRYAYRLEGYDRDWIESDANRRLASYSGLPPGDYTLRIRGGGRDGVLSSELELPVRILPAYWQRTWFLVLSCAAVLLLLLAAQRWYTARIRRRAQELQDLVAQRTAELSDAKERAEAALEQLKAAQDELVAQEKLASLGQLVAGVAHEINTPVGVALTASSFLGDRSRQLDAHLQEGRLKREELSSFVSHAQEAAAMIESNLKRAAELVRNFKQVSVDRSSDDRRTFDLGNNLNALIDSLRLTWKRRPIQLDLHCPANLSMDSYPGALGQVLTNLIQNALLHAFPDDSRNGRMSIDVSEPSGGTVSLRFSDDGAGINSSDLGRIFEPFFTTRRAQGGSGLGLHIVFNLVTAKLGGRIQVRSELGKGTQFELRIPLRAP